MRLQAETQKTHIPDPAANLLQLCLDVPQLLHMGTMCYTKVRPHALWRAPKLCIEAVGINAASASGSKRGGGGGVKARGGAHGERLVMVG